MVTMFVPFATDGSTDVMARLTPSFRAIQPSR
jgi:tripartite-type tricarboxylate transporter receptor subunit TctC